MRQEKPNDKLSKDVTIAYFTAVLSLGATGIALPFTMGAKDPSLTFESYHKHPVEQVFSDHNGYVTIHTGPNHTVVKNKYHESGRYDSCKHEAGKTISDFARTFDNGKTIDDYIPNLSINDIISNAQVRKDLKQGEKGYAETLEYRVTPDSYFCGPRVRSITVIHLPSGQPITPGVSSTGGKNPQYPAMQELR